MKLFVDEDVGSGLARALIESGITDVDYVGNDRQIKRGTLDIDWLPYAGQNGYLVLSRNKEMLRVPVERRLLIAAKVGIVFLPGHRATAPELLLLVLQKLDWLDRIDATIPRPFAFVISRNGRTAQRMLSL